MELVSPGLGLIFWMTLAFGTVLLVLRKYAWRPILNTIRERELTISQSLRDAQHIRRELASLEEVKKQKLREAEKLRLELLAQARTEADEVIRNARQRANAEVNQIMEEGKKAVEAQRMAVVHEIRDQIARLSIDIAEQVLEGELKDKKISKNLVDQLMDKVVLN
ncbi:MAG: F0F1 ATP synthase subunit B [Bacteroides sp.]|jgi:F-type H+-transporting ATPase subunit b|nr:F0F1 ATP synthase subunit B [Bacteroides sp.]